MIRKIDLKYYKTIKEKRLKKDKEKCTRCNSKKNLICHHNSYENCPYEKIEDLITLCRKCHSKEHKKELSKWEIERDAIIIKRYKKFGRLLIDELLFEMIGKPERVDIFLFKNKIIIRNSKEGKFDLSKKEFRGRTFHFIEEKIFAKLKQERIKYVKIELILKNNAVKFPITKLF